MVVQFTVFLTLSTLICRGTDISKYFSESLGNRDNESRLYLFPASLFSVLERKVVGEGDGRGARSGLYGGWDNNCHLKELKSCTVDEAVWEGTLSCKRRTFFFGLAWGATFSFDLFFKITSDQYLSVRARPFSLFFVYNLMCRRFTDAKPVSYLLQCHSAIFVDKNKTLNICHNCSCHSSACLRCLGLPLTLVLPSPNFETWL